MMTECCLIEANTDLVTILTPIHIFKQISAYKIGFSLVYLLRRPDRKNL